MVFDKPGTATKEQVEQIKEGLRSGQATIEEEKVSFPSFQDIQARVPPGRLGVRILRMTDEGFVVELPGGNGQRVVPIEGPPTRITGDVVEYPLITYRQGEYAGHIDPTTMAQLKPPKMNVRSIEDEVKSGMHPNLKTKGGFDVTKAKPGAAAATGPEFEAPKFKGYAEITHRASTSITDARDFFGQSDVTGADFRRYNDLNQRQTLPPQKLRYIQEVLTKYNSDEVFRRFADGMRHYVHNNPAIVDSSRAVLGMSRIQGPWGLESVNLGSDIKRTGYRINPTTLLDGKVDDAWIMSEARGKRIAEDVLMAIREAPERDLKLFRGMTFSGAESESVASFAKFLKLGKGDIIDLPLSSFSEDIQVVKESFQFSRDIFDTHDVMLVLEGPKKAVNAMPFNSVREGEWVTQGTFEVVNKVVDHGGKGTRVVLVIKQTGVF